MSPIAIFKDLSQFMGLRQATVAYYLREYALRKNKNPKEVNNITSREMYKDMCYMTRYQIITTIEKLQKNGFIDVETHLDLEAYASDASFDINFTDRYDEIPFGSAI